MNRKKEKKVLIFEMANYSLSQIAAREAMNILGFEVGVCSWKEDIKWHMELGSGIPVMAIVRGFLDSGYLYVNRRDLVGRSNQASWDIAKLLFKWDVPNVMMLMVDYYISHPGMILIPREGNKHFEYFEDMIRMEAFEVFYTTSKFEVNGGVNSLIQPWKEAGEIFSRHVVR